MKYKTIASDIVNQCKQDRDHCISHMKLMHKQYLNKKNVFNNALRFVGERNVALSFLLIRFMVSSLSDFSPQQRPPSSLICNLLIIWEQTHTSILNNKIQNSTFFGTFLVVITCFCLVLAMMGYFWKVWLVLYKTNCFFVGRSRNQAILGTWVSVCARACACLRACRHACGSM